MWCYKKTLPTLKSFDRPPRSPCTKSRSPEPARNRGNVPYTAKKTNSTLGCIRCLFFIKHKSPDPDLQSYLEAIKNKHYRSPKSLSGKPFASSTEQCLHRVNKHFTCLCQLRGWFTKVMVILRHELVNWLSRPTCAVFKCCNTWQCTDI